MNPKNISININLTKEEIKEAEKYFLPKSNEEDMPIKIEIKDQIKYYKLEKIFNSFYTEDSLSIAKDKSREEREKKGIKDSSFVYGEIVYKLIFINITYRHFVQLHIFMNI